MKLGKYKHWQHSIIILSYQASWKFSVLVTFKNVFKIWRRNFCSEVDTHYFNSIFNKPKPTHNAGFLLYSSFSTSILAFLWTQQNTKKHEEKFFFNVCRDFSKLFLWHPNSLCVFYLVEVVRWKTRVYS